MIALLLLQATLGPIGRQELPKDGCAAYLWSLGVPRQLVAMAGPARLRIQLDGRTLDLQRTGGTGAAGLGLAAMTRYAAGGVSATLDLALSDQAPVARGALVRDATLTVEPQGRDVIVTPVGGMVGCGE